MDDIIIIRGGGDLATGIIQKFYRAGFKVLVLEIEKPSTIRKNVALSQAIYINEVQVEDLTAKKVTTIDQIHQCWKEDVIPIMIDEKADIINILKPDCLIDAIIAKKNIGTTKDMANVVIGIGPGFSAKEDVDVVVETMRGHNLGKLIFEGSAFPNTGIPGEIGGQSKLRVIHAKCEGLIKHCVSLGEIVEENQTILTVDNIEHKSLFKGRVRGLIESGYLVKKGMKIADVDPRLDVEWDSISDKARSIGGGALEAYLYFRKMR